MFAACLQRLSPVYWQDTAVLRARGADGADAADAVPADSEPETEAAEQTERLETPGGACPVATQLGERTGPGDLPPGDTG